MIGLASGGLSGGENDQTLAAFAEQTGVTFPLAWDADTRADFNFPENVSPYPRQVLLSADRELIYIASEYQYGALEAALQQALGPDAAR